MPIDVITRYDKTVKYEKSYLMVRDGNSKCTVTPNQGVWCDKSRKSMYCCTVMPMVSETGYDTKTRTYLSWSNSMKTPVHY